MTLFTGHGAIAAEFSKKYRCDILSLRNKSVEELEVILQNYDYVIHNSANLNPENIAQATEDNFLLTKKIVDTINKVNPNASFIYLSSMSILKNSEEYLSPLLMSDYSFSKYLGEIYSLKSQLRKSKAVRFSTIFYGDKSRDGLSRLISDAAESGEVSLIDDGISRRDFIPIEIAIDYLFSICTINSSRSIINVCSGNSVSFAEITEILKLRIGNLKVDNKNGGKAVSVLHEFTNEGLREFGIINFDLGEYVFKYLADLKGNEDLNL